VDELPEKFMPKKVEAALQVGLATYCRAAYSVDTDEITASATPGKDSLSDGV
jgi:hypothetical protein